MCVQKNSGNKICRQRYVYAKQMCIRHMHVRHAFMWILYCFKLYYIILYYIILYVNNLTLVPGLQFNRMLKCSAVSDATRTCASNHSVLFLAMWVLSHKSSGMKANGFICIVWYMHYHLVPFDTPHARSCLKFGHRRWNKRDLARGNYRKSEVSVSTGSLLVCPMDVDSEIPMPPSSWRICG